MERILDQVFIALLFAAIMMTPVSGHARWAIPEQAPLQIVRNDQAISVAQNGTWTLRGFLEIKVNSDSGRALVAPFRMPDRDDLEETHIVSAEITEGSSTRVVPNTQFKSRQVEQKAGRPFASQKAIEIDFGDAALGANLRIEYEVFNNKNRIADLFSMAFIWGQTYPELKSNITIESFTPLTFDISKAATRLLEFKEGRSKDGTRLRWEFGLKAPVYRRLDGELGGLSTTELIPRVQISNQKNWSVIASPLTAIFEKQLQTPLPPELKKIAAESSIGRLEDRINSALEKTRRIISRRSDWSPEDNSLGLTSLQEIVKRRSADPKEYAMVIVAILRAMGIPAHPALAWREPQTERLIIEEKPTAPGFQIFNHVLVRWGTERPRYFDPSLSVSFADGYLTSVGGSWALPLITNSAELEYLPLNDPAPSNVRIQQQLEPRADLTTHIQGTVTITGPLAAELKQLYYTAGSSRTEPYLRQLFGIGLQSTSQPMVRVTDADTVGTHMEISFNSIQDAAVKPSGSVRYVTFPVPGLLSSPLFATPDRVSDVGLIRNLAVDIDTSIRGAPVSDEAPSSCLSLNRFASIVRETIATPQSATIKDNIRFKTGRITPDEMNSESFKKELVSYTSCLSRNSVAFGPRPNYSDPKWGMSDTPQRILSVLSKSPTNLSLTEIHALSDLGTSRITQAVQSKVWLGLRSVLRQTAKDPTLNHRILLEYAKSILRLGQLEDESYLPEHVAEAAKIFTDIAKPLEKNAELHRLHFILLYATERYKEAFIALKNATTLEPSQLQDQVYLSMLYVKLGKTVLAETTLESAVIADGPANWKARAYQTLAEIKLAQKNVAQFEKLVEQAIRLEPQNPWLRYNYAQQLFLLKNWDKAIAQCKSAISITPLPLAENLLARTLMNKALTYYYSGSAETSPPTTNPKQLEQAERLALEAIRYSPRDGTAYRIVGHAAFEKALNGDYASLIAAQNYLSKASDILGNDDWIQERLFYANQALHSGKKLQTLWKARVPAGK